MIILRFIVLVIGLIWKKDRSKIIFSEWYGKSSVDSPYYFFQEASNDLNIKAFWVTKDENEFIRLKAENPHILKANSLLGIWHQSTAWTLVSSVNSRDFFYASLLRRKNYIMLGHGLPYKTYFAERHNKWNTFKHWVRGKTIDSYSYVGSTGKAFDEILAKQYQIHKTQVLRLPTVRCVEFLKITELEVDQIEKEFGKSIIFYMPTHRDEGKSINQIEQNVKDLAGIIKEHYPNFSLVVKLHFYDQHFGNRIRNIPGVKLFENGNYFGIMKQSKIFIGDYSGVVFDSYYLDQSRLAYIPDIEQYLTNHRGLYFEHNEVYDHVCLNKGELQSSIKKIFSLSKEYNAINITKFIENRELKTLVNDGYNVIKSTIK